MADRNAPPVDAPAGGHSPSSPRPKLQGHHRTTTNPGRLPPPTLFQGPPSKNASHISLVLPDDGQHRDQNANRHRGMPRASHVPPAMSFSGSSLRRPSNHIEEFRAESHWAEMQKTLADVELSAMNPSHVFGAEHAKALEDLRNAQLSLAQAWAKSEADEITEHDGLDAEGADVGSPVNKPPPTSSKRGSRASSINQDRSLEQETERDIRLARRRREANDRYFQQVNKGVLEVVRRLDEVAGAMRRVERESRDIWNDDDSAMSAGDAGRPGRDSVGLADTPTDGSPSLLTDSPQSHRARR